MTSSTIPREGLQFPTLAGFLVLAFALYGRHLGEGLLSDDFLYAHWRDLGLRDLFAHLTWDSNPRMIRPLAILPWWLGGLAGGVVLQHALSVLLHGLTAGLTARLAERCRPGTGSAAGLLFVVFPFFPEPVIWLSSVFDPLATVLTLAALEVGLGGRATKKAERRRPIAAATLFGLALLSKESVLLTPALPLLLPALGPRSRRLRLAAALAIPTVAVLGLRLVLFGGPGGYLDGDERSVLWQVDPLLFLRNALLQVPYRLLQPFKTVPDAFIPVVLLTSCVLLGTLALRIRPRPVTLLQAALAYLLALAPTAPVFGLGAEHENSRMLYFPLAVLAIAAVPLFERPGRREPVLLLAIFWTVATLVNAAPWSAADREIRTTLEALHQHPKQGTWHPEQPDPQPTKQGTWHPGSTILVAGHDSLSGAYVWRNALHLATRRVGLRSDLHWRLGTFAAAPDLDPAELGRTVFEFEPTPDGLIDRTLCRQALEAGPSPHLATASDLEPVNGRLEVLRLPLDPAPRALAVVLTGADATGRLYWKDPGKRRFRLVQSRRFASRDRAIVLLTPEEPLSHLGLRIDLDPGSPSPTDLQVAAAPEICESP